VRRKGLGFDRSSGAEVPRRIRAGLALGLDGEGAGAGVIGGTGDEANRGGELHRGFRVR
jgi:hypothetical protein